MNRLDELADSRALFRRGPRWIFHNSKRIAAYTLAVGGAVGIVGALSYHTGHSSGSKEEKELQEFIQREMEKELRKDAEKERKRLKKEKADLESQVDALSRENTRLTGAKKQETELRKNAEKRVKEYRKLYNKSEETVKWYNTELTKLELTKNGLLEDVANRQDIIDRTEDKLEKVRQSKTGLEEQIKEARDTLAAAEKRYTDKSSEYTSLKKRYEKLKEDYNNFQEEIESNIEETEAINNALAKDKERLEDDVTALTTEIEKVKKNYRKIQEDHERVKKLYGDSIKDLASVKRKNDSLQSEYDTLQEDDEAHKKEISRLEASIRQLRKALTDTNELERMHQTEISDLNKKHEREMQKQEDKYETRIANILEDLSDKDKELNKALEELTKAEGKITGLRKEISDYERKEEGYLKTIKYRNETIRDQRISIDNLTTSRDEWKKNYKEATKKLKEADAYATELEKEKASLEKKLEDAGADQTKISKRLAEIAAEKEELIRFKESLPSEYKILFDTRIAFINSGNLCISDGDLDISHRGTRLVLEGEVRRPRISPNRKYVAFEYLPEDHDKFCVCIYSIPEKLDSPLTHITTIKDSENNREVAWISDDEVLKLAFIAGEKNDELWLYDQSKEEEFRPLIDNDRPGSLGQITVSPDGKRIAYVVFSEYDEREGKDFVHDRCASQVWMLDNYGSNRQVTLEDNKYNTQPVWLNNDVLAYVKEDRCSESEIHLLDLRRDEVWKEDPDTGEDKKWRYRNVTYNVGCSWFPIVDLFSSRNKADFNPAVNSEGSVLYTNESDGIVIKHPTKTISDGLLDKPEDMPYDEEEVISSDAKDRHSRAVFYADGKMILAKVGDRLYRLRKADGEYEKSYIAHADEKRDFHIR